MGLSQVIKVSTNPQMRGGEGGILLKLGSVHRAGPMVDWDKFDCGGLKEFASKNKSQE